MYKLLIQEEIICNRSKVEKPLYFDPFGQNNINHLVQVSLEFFCRFETSSPGVRGNNKIYSNE